MKSPSLDVIPDPAVRGYLRRRRNWLALLAAVTMLAVMWPNLAMSHEVATYLLPFLSAAASLPLALVFAGPAAVRVGWAAVTVVGSACSLIPHPGADFAMPIPMFLVLFVMTIAALITQPLSRIPVIVVLTAGAIVLGVQPDARIGWIFSLVVTAVLIAFVRYRLVSQRTIARRTEETHDAQAREAVLAERTRIARELHDVVAHRMSMVVVMSQTARYRLAAEDPPETVGPGAVAEFDAIADAARQSLDEVRQLLGVLRPVGPDEAVHAGRVLAPASDLRALPAASPTLQPVQGIADLPGLIASVRAAGVEVTFDDRSGAGGDADAAGAAVYRIVQESLTNAARHAPGASVSVVLDRGDDGDLTLSVVNSKPAGGPATDTGRGGGHGLIGMAERAAAVGGEVRTGATDDGGFAVTARIARAAGAGRD